MTPTPEQAAAPADVIEQQIEAWSELLRSGALTAVDFAKEQVPGILSEMLLYARVTSAVGLFFWSVVLFVAWRWLLDALSSKERDRFGDITGKNVAKCLVSAVALALGSICAIVCAMTLAKSVLAPRLYLIEELGRILS